MFSLFVKREKIGTQIKFLHGGLEKSCLHVPERSPAAEGKCIDIDFPSGKHAPL